jgi:hypothetical protein
MEWCRALASAGTAVGDPPVQPFTADHKVQAPHVHQSPAADLVKHWLKLQLRAYTVQELGDCVHSGAVQRAVALEEEHVELDHLDVADNLEDVLEAQLPLDNLHRVPIVIAVLLIHLLSRKADRSGRCPGMRTAAALAMAWNGTMVLEHALHCQRH